MDLIVLRVLHWNKQWFVKDSGSISRVGATIWVRSRHSLPPQRWAIRFYHEDKEQETSSKHVALSVQLSVHA